MTLTLELSSEVEEAPEEMAQAEGRDPAEYAAQIIHLHLAPAIFLIQRSGRSHRSLNTDLTIDNKLELLAQWQTEVAMRPDYRAEAGLGTLPDDAVEDVYRAREDIQR